MGKKLVVRALLTVALCIWFAGVLWRSPGWAQQAQPAAAADGTIAGKVLDASTGDPIIEAGVEVVGRGKKVRTDLDGKYSITIAPGTYELRIFAPLYRGARLQRVIVQAGRVTKGDVTLSPQGQACIQVVEVVAQADKAAEATQLIERKKSPVVSDNISAETIQKTTDSNAGEIVQRAPGVTVKDNKFFIVRGLDERYTSALLNGSRLSSTDPDKRVVPLDLFPADFIESLSRFKTYTPDLPGDFSGGLADIRLKESPEKFSYSLGISTGANTEATFRKFNTYKGAGIGDYFGFGTEYRELPDNFPNSIVDAPDAQLQAYGRELRDIWNVRTQTALPNFSGNFSVGDSFGPLGVALSGIYTTEYKARNNEIDNEYSLAGDRFVGIDEFTYDVSTFETRLGGVLNTSYKLSPDHRISFRALVDRNTSDEVKTGSGEAIAQPGHRITEQLQYTEQRLAFGQLAGEHHFSVAQIEWRTAFTQTIQNVPDTRIVTRKDGAFINDANGGTRYYTNLEEHLTDSAVDVTIPFTTRLPFTDVWSGLPAKFKFGPAYAYRNHDFRLRRFRYLVRDQSVNALPTETLLAPENIGPFNAVDFQESPQAGLSFSGTHEIAAGYGMFDLPVYPGTKTESGGTVNQVRLVAGVRTDYSYIFLNTVEENSIIPAHIPKNNLDVLPGINLIYSPRDDMNVRFGYSQAVSRPDFREQSPVLYPQARGLRSTVGNPDLVEASIESWDLRWEWFFSPAEIVSFSFFYKSIDKPIEKTVINFAGSEPVDSFENADSGRVTGFEFEGRKNFGWVSPHLTDLNLLLNVTYADSTVTVPKNVNLAQAQTNTQRALQGTSPYVINATLDYGHPLLGTVRLLYNTYGERISAAGANGLPDIFEQPRDEVDFVWLRQITPFGTPLNAKLGIENILNDKYLFLQGDEITQRYRTGVKFSFGLSYSY
jgi:outer membrane receptor protein involved in Fe transport